MNIVLTGLMGSGKTTTGQILASKLGMDFVDTDLLVEKEAGKSIVEIFSSEGETQFRKFEKKMVEKVSSLKNTVISTGGGAILDKANFALLSRTGFIVFLDTPLETIRSRLKENRDRPLLTKSNGIDFLPEMLEARMKDYLNADLVVSVSESSKAASEIVSFIRSVKLCASVSSLEEAKKAINLNSDFVELRIDLMEDKNELEEIVGCCSAPLIVTNRSDSTDEMDAINLGCEFVDVDLNKKNSKRIIKRARENGCKIISSFHDFYKTPGSEKLLEVLSTQMKQGDIGKIVVKGTNQEDFDSVLSVLRIAKERNFPLISFLMGDSFSHTRILAPLKGSFLSFCSIGISTAPGQLSLEETGRRLKKHD